jgi:two-component system KDP operon response regulator KdpE
MTGVRILLVDDEPAVLRALRANLLARGYAVTAVGTGEEALQQLSAQHPDLAILDLMLPGLSGIEVTEAIRQQSSIPILVLSARGEEATKVQALDLGADDYLTKPFGIDELLARVRALLRRPAAAAGPDGTLQVGTLTLIPGAHEIRRDGAHLNLTPREYDVLAYLMRNAGKVVTHRLLLQEVWGREYGRETQYLRVFINRLRRKIEDDASHPRYIVTEPGVGYRLVTPA